jgi:hypothetical protein
MQDSLHVKRQTRPLLTFSGFISSLEGRSTVGLMMLKVKVRSACMRKELEAKPKVSSAWL